MLEEFVHWKLERCERDLGREGGNQPERQAVYLVPVLWDLSMHGRRENQKAHLAHHCDRETSVEAFDTLGIP